MHIEFLNHQAHLVSVRKDFDEYIKGLSKVKTLKKSK